MNISLINPPQTELREPTSYIPLGLAYIASALLKEGFEGFDNVRVDNLAGKDYNIDYNIDNKKDGNIDYNIDDIKIDFADIFAITCMSAGLKGVGRVVHHIRERYPESKIILGGPHPTVSPNDVYQEFEPDLLIRGEAESVVRDFDNIGFGFRGIHDAGIITDLDSLPFPARRLFDYNNVVCTSGIHGCEKGIRSSTLITSRGCPYSCRFCCRKHPMYSKYRYRSAENVRDELISLREDYGIEHVRFVDDCFTLINNRVEKICKYTKELDMTFMCITRADTCDIGLLKTLKYGGCTIVDIGVESGSDRLLAKMNKRETIDQMKQCILDAKNIGLKTKVFLQYNLPGETEDDIQKTMNFLKDVKPDYYTLSRYTPLPGSKWADTTVVSRLAVGAGKFDTPNGWFYNDNDEKRNRLISEIEEILYE